MATYAQYRHVELDKVGCGKKRITKPPGGDASDIFGSQSPTTTPPTTPRKVKNYLASNIFSAEKADQQPKSRPRPEDNSFNRLFGAKDAPDGGSPVRVKNYQKSNIIMNDTNGVNGKAHVNGEKNGHASPNGHGSDSGVGSGSVTPNGSTNGDAEPKTNGHTNGHGNGHIEHGTPTRRIPPGGYSNIGNIFSH